MPHPDPRMRAKGDHRYPTYTTGRLGLSLAPKPLSLGTTSGSPSSACVPASTCLPPPTPCHWIRAFWGAWTSQPGRTLRGGGPWWLAPPRSRWRASRRESANAMPGRPQKSSRISVRNLRTPTPPTYSSRPRRIQLPDRAQTTTPTMPRGNYTSRNAPLRAPVQGTCAAMADKRLRGAVGPGHGDSFPLLESALWARAAFVRPQHGSLDRLGWARGELPGRGPGVFVHAGGGRGHVLVLH